MDLLLLGFSFVDLRLLGLSEPFDTDFLLLPLLLFLFSSFFLLPFFALFVFFCSLISLSASFLTSLRSFGTILVRVFRRVIFVDFQLLAAQADTWHRTCVGESSASSQSSRKSIFPRSSETGPKSVTKSPTFAGASLSVDPNK